MKSEFPAGLRRNSQGATETALTLHRQSDIYAREGVEIDRSAMAPKPRGFFEVSDWEAMQLVEAVDDEED